MIEFTKMHGAGNDFVVLFNPVCAVPDVSVSALCNRRTGIGADGLIVLRPLAQGVFRMEFFNNDGSRAGMCGNGLRCAGLFAARISGQRVNTFRTDSGDLTAEVLSDNGKSGRVRIMIRKNLAFRDCGIIAGFRVYYGIAGVPHAVVPVPDVSAVDVVSVGRNLRYHPFFAPDGTNVDFVETEPELHRIRTYERGVEDETPACGTGIVSAGVVLHEFFQKGKKVCFLSRSNAELEVEILQDCNILLNKTPDDVSDRAYLTGPAEESFRGVIQINGK